MANTFVSLNREGAVGFLTLNRPPANSYDLEFVKQFTTAVKQAAQDDAVKVVIVQSTLEKFFCAGADVKFFSQGTFESNMEMINAEHAALEDIARIPKIFIAMIGGHALGGGLEIALACDLRFCGDGEFKIGLPEVSLGLIPGNGGTQRLPRVIGRARALDLMITGARISPKDALTYGIVDCVFPQAELRAKTLEYAENLAHGATFAIGRIKLAVHQGLDVALSDGLAFERKVTAAVFKSEDSKEGIAAFAEKRKPNYKGK